MSRSIFRELYQKAFKSGNPVFLFIGINVLVFLGISLIAVIEFLVKGADPSADWITDQLSMPTAVSSMILKPWTILTYMFTHREVFHILFNMLWLYWLGMIFNDFLNKRQFIFTYLAGGLGGAILYLLCFNLLPVFSGYSEHHLLGASAGVMAVVFATATLVPDYSIRLLFFGNVKLKYLALAYFALNIITITSNPGSSIAHLGGALLGFIYIKILRSGTDLSNILKWERGMKVVRNSGEHVRRSESLPDQATIDRILDKISQSGYDSLTKAEKEALFKASKK